MKKIMCIAVIIGLAANVASAISTIKNKAQKIKSIKLEKELTLGETPGANDPLFQSIRSFRVDEEGNIYVLDMRALKLLKFDRTGKKVYSIGRKGQGPGEFMAPSGIELGKDNSILIFDVANRRLSYFTRANGDLLKEISTAKWPRLFRVSDDSQGNFYGYMVVYEQDKTKRVICKFSSELDLVKEIHEINDKALSNEIQVIATNLLFRVLNNDGLLVANNQEYIFYEYNTAGDLVRTIQNDYRPVRITEADKKRELKARFEGAPAPKDQVFVFPDNYPPIEHMITDNRGNIYIRRYELDKAGNAYYEAFNRDAKPLGKFSLPSSVFCVVDNRMYSLESDQSGLNQICCYKFAINK
jgi:hypothetical protein